jgi:hypothetical protein
MHTQQRDDRNGLGKIEFNVVTKAYKHDLITWPLEIYTANVLAAFWAISLSALLLASATCGAGAIWKAVCWIDMQGDIGRHNDSDFESTTKADILPGPVVERPDAISTPPVGI